MRTIKYLSPTSYKLYCDDKDEFYRRYLSDTRRPREPQTRPMAVGSAFDAYVKASLQDRLLGVKDTFTTLFEKQVEPHNRDWARIHGKKCYDFYIECGAFADLALILAKSDTTPKFEFEVEGLVSTEIGGAKLLGRPDCHFTLQGMEVILDWKINGYEATRTRSPMPGYTRIRPSGKMHKDCIVQKINGIDINIAAKLEDLDVDWATQIAVYSWLCAGKVGERCVAAIHQFTGPELRVAEHSCFVGAEFQQSIFKHMVSVWEIVTSPHYFRELTLEQSMERCAQLDEPEESLI